MDAHDRYDRYADAFDNPVTAESIELGNRVLHWMFVEAWDRRGAVADRLAQAQGRRP